MKDDDGKGRYFAGLSIFMFSMIGIVLADNLIMLFVFWELVGFSSYGLIAHYKDTEEASNASKYFSIPIIDKVNRKNGD
ncbi:hypothetical protein AYO37_00825 [Opitutia bacterium SCGC AG-212-L18]|nr:hypothetical protein AYO37_00825 [Opitutae bacterium SCGC AG-212-L18]